MASHACVREQTFVRLPFAAFSETAGWVGANQACLKSFNLRHCANTQQAPDIGLVYFKQAVETGEAIGMNSALVAYKVVDWVFTLSINGEW